MGRSNFANVEPLLVDNVGMEDELMRPNSDWRFVFERVGVDPPPLPNRRWMAVDNR